MDFVKFETANIANHVRWCKKNPKYDNYMDRAKVSMAERNKLRTAESYLRAAEKIKKRHEEGYYVEGHNKRRGQKGTPHTDESKKKLSEARIKFLKENPEKHPWKRHDKFVSVPCENVKKFLNRLSIPFQEEFQPLADRMYSIDIAFPNLKIAVEINGNQHYNADGTLKPYYQERHDLLVAAGWTVIEIHYSRCFADGYIASELSDVIS